MSQSLSIGLIAYGLDEHRVFVRVPNERGRWVFVDRCVVEVDCPLCKAITGEPCRSTHSDFPHGWSPHDPIRYHVGVHIMRKAAWQKKTGHRFQSKHALPHKARIGAEDMAALADDPELVEITPEQIADLKKIEPFFGLSVQSEAMSNGGGHVHYGTMAHVMAALDLSRSRALDSEVKRK